MTTQETLKIELMQTALKIEKIKQYQRNLEQKLAHGFLDWADVGDAQRFNSLLQEIVEIYQYQK